MIKRGSIHASEESNKERNCSVWSREKNQKRSRNRFAGKSRWYSTSMRNSLLKLAQRRRKLSLLGKLWKLIRADYCLHIYFIRLYEYPRPFFERNISPYLRYPFDRELEIFETLIENRNR